MKAKTPSFVTEVPLVVDAGQERILLVRFDAARQVYNACLGESLRRLDLVRQSGESYQKSKNRSGEGVVGLDIGPSTIAVTGDDQARLVRFCDELADRQKRIRQLQRRLDRQRRANNPDYYHPNGTVKAGPRRWRSSRRQRQTRLELSEVQRKQAAHRKSLHGQLANQVLAMGRIVRTEKLSYKAFQRMYGKSVGFRAPGLFVSILRRKAASAGGAVEEFPTRTTRLSQVCLCGAVAKKSLAQRWHRCACGVVAQRDLFSSFLARCVEGDALNAGLASQLWPRVDYLLQAALSDRQATSDRDVPASFGLIRRQSCSLAEVYPTNGKALDGVAHVIADVSREPERAVAAIEPHDFSRGE